jgi:hypothetical protein
MTGSRRGYRDVISGNSRRMVPMTGAITAAATFARSLASPIAAPWSTLRYLDISQSAPLEIGPKRGSDDFRLGEPYVADAIARLALATKREQSSDR